jgi:tRNA-dihydrouridine synthase C
VIEKNSEYPTTHGIKRQNPGQNVPFILMAPMEGVVDAVVRRLFSRVGGYSRFVTEFVRVTDQIVPDHVFYKHCPELRTNGRTEFGDRVYVQLLGGRPERLAENALRAVALGAPGIDLNFGCPAKTVNRHDGGAALLKSPRRLFDVISAVKGAVAGAVPVTAKTRLGFSDKSLVKEIAEAVKEAAPDQLTVHARTRDEGYRPPAHWEFIARIREIVEPVPVVANGDIWRVEDYFRCRTVSGCDSVALGRGAMARPSLANEIRAAVALKDSLGLGWNEIQTQLLPDFLRWSTEYRSDHYALARVKQWSKMLGRSYPEAEVFFAQIKGLQSANDVGKALPCPSI